MTICSGVLYGYYRLALVNRPFHHWNRAYLLLIAVISPAIPLMKWSVLPALPAAVNHTIESGDMPQKAGGIFEQSPVLFEHRGSMASAVEIIYILIGLVVLLRLLMALVHIGKMIRRSVVIKKEDHFLVMTAERNAPFSFFKYVFWNMSISVDSDAGEKMLRHELAHVRGKHSVDKLIMSILHVPLWCNPFYWLIRREIDVVHEFIADSKMLSAGDHAGLSNMILTAAYPSRNFSVTSNFYSSSIKRRLHMLNKSFQQKKNYFRFLLAVPVLLALLAAFTFSRRQTAGSAPSVRAITIVIDAGHGGQDNGAVAADGIREKDIALSLATKIQQLNTDPNIHILLTRTKDRYPELRDRVDFSLKAKPDAFISMHVNADSSGVRGIEFYTSRNKPQFAKQVNALQSLISQQMKSVYPSGIVSKQAVNRIWVLDAEVVNYPAILIECGNLLNTDDLAFISDLKHQKEMATQILKALSGYAATM